METRGVGPCGQPCDRIADPRAGGIVARSRLRVAAAKRTSRSRTGWVRTRGCHRPPRGLVPVVNIAPAEGWADGEKPPSRRDARDRLRRRPRPSALAPRAAQRRRAGRGDQRAGAAAQGGKGIKGWVMGKVMKHAGAAVPSANRITLLRDADGDGSRRAALGLPDGLNSPFGMALVGDELYVANTDAVVRFPYRPGDTHDHGARRRRSPTCPAARSTTTGPRTSSPAPTARSSTSRVGSNSNVAEHGMDEEDGRAAILESRRRDRRAPRLRVRACATRTGMAWEPATRRAVDGGQRARRARQRPRARLHDLGRATAASTAGRTATTASTSTSACKPPRPDSSPRRSSPTTRWARTPPRWASRFADGARCPPRFASGMFVGQHGSWNRRPRSGYKVIFVPFGDGRPSGAPIDVLTGFVDEDGDAHGPAGGRRRSTSAARCWSPTTSATSSGASKSH